MGAADDMIARGRARGDRLEISGEAKAELLKLINFNDNQTDPHERFTRKEAASMLAVSFGLIMSMDTFDRIVERDLGRTWSGR